MADDQDKTAEAPEATDKEIAEGFGNAGAEGTARDKYIANFEGDEINGKRYKLGEEIADDVDAGTLAYLVQNGRITPKSAEDSDAMSLGGDANDATGTGGNAGGGTGEGGGGTDPFAAYDLSDEERAEAEKLKADNTAEKLRDLAGDGVELESDDNKSDVAAKIVISRRA